MILHCDFEELAALNAGARECLAAMAGGVTQLAPEQAVGAVEALIPRLTGDIDVETLEDQESLELAIERILICLKERMDSSLLERFVGAEEAVIAYFDYAHVLTVHGRITQMGREMAGVIELMTGQPVTTDAAREVRFDED